MWQCAPLVRLCRLWKIFFLRTLIPPHPGLLFLYMYMLGSGTNRCRSYTGPGMGHSCAHGQLHVQYRDTYILDTVLQCVCLRA